MATFSTNQVRQLYVAKTFESSYLTADKPVGSIAVKGDDNKEYMYFEYMSVGGQVRSDLIDTYNIHSITPTDAKKMLHVPLVHTVKLDEEVNGGNLVGGQDYILRIAFRKFVGVTESDQYFKYGEVHVYNGMEVSDFYKKMVISLAKNFSKEAVPLVKFSLKTSSSTVPVNANTKESDLTDTYEGIEITEVEQPWRRGVKKSERVDYEVYPLTITVDGDDRIWGTVESKEDENYEGTNGKIMADLEYFCMGERGDIYRGQSWPHNLETTYLVDPSLNYNAIDIVYCYTGQGVSTQESLKTITILIPKVGSSDSESNALANQILSAIGTAANMYAGGFPT